MSAWAPDDFRDAVLDDYGQLVGDNSIDTYGNWQSPEAELAAALNQLQQETDRSLVVLRELRDTLSVDDPANERSEQGDDRPLTEAAA